MAVNLTEGNNVLIHCSEGYDRTSQLSAITQILLDKYYRTKRGFAALIEKDFVQFGFQFRHRNGFFIDETTRDKESPVFIMFLDCVYQIMRQYPKAFEFTYEMLVYLADCQKNGKYGTFLANNEKERQDMRILTETLSVWSDFRWNAFTNYSFKESDDVLVIDSSSLAIKVWKEYFGRFASYEEKANSNGEKKTVLLNCKQRKD